MKTSTGTSISESRKTFIVNYCDAPAVGGPCVMPKGHLGANPDIPETHVAEPDGRWLRHMLHVAELELVAWISGHRSRIDEHMNVESSVENRGRTLVETAQRDAAELDLAIQKVRALRMLCGLTEEGLLKGDSDA